MAEGKLKEQFEVVHVDYHADLGLGCASANFLQGAFLTLPVKTRRKVRNYEFNRKIEEINIGDYLLWRMAYKMILKIIYCVNPNDEINHYCCWDTLKDFH